MAQSWKLGGTRYPHVGRNKEDVMIARQNNSHVFGWFRGLGREGGWVGGEERSVVQGRFSGGVGV